MLIVTINLHVHVHTLLIGILACIMYLIHFLQILFQPSSSCYACTCVCLLHVYYMCIIQSCNNVRQSKFWNHFFQTFRICIGKLEDDDTTNGSDSCSLRFFGCMRKCVHVQLLTPPIMIKWFFFSWKWSLILLFWREPWCKPLLFMWRVWISEAASCTHVQYMYM